MKKTWIIIVSILGILLIAGGSVVYFSGMLKEKNPEPTTTPSPSPTPDDELPPEEEIIEYYEKMEYVCTKPEVQETLEGTEYTYLYQNQYHFIAQKGKVVTGEVIDRFQFDSKDTYQAFLDTSNNTETNFKTTTDEKNLTINSQLYMIFYPEDATDDFVADESYLTFLSQKGYTCELQKTTTDKN